MPNTRQILIIDDDPELRLARILPAFVNLGRCVVGGIVSARVPFDKRQGALTARGRSVLLSRSAIFVTDAQAGQRPVLKPRRPGRRQG
jgi:hypothetical protein